MKNQEKAPKAPKKSTKQKKAQKAKKVKKEKDPSAKKKIPKIVFIILPVILVLAVATTVVYMLFFRTPSEQEQIEKIAKDPDAYKIGEDEVISLEKVIGEEGVVTRTSVESPTENGPQEWVYHYRQLEKRPSRIAEDYLDVLRDEEQGFTVTDAEHHILEEEPDMTAAIGSVILAKESAENAETPEGGGEDAGGGGETTGPKLVEVMLAWSETALAIQVSQPEGTILPPVPEPDPSEIQREPLAMKAQLEYFNNLEPSKLGLPGDFMSEYRVYPVDGLVRVSNVTCRVLNVYLMDLPEETNTFMGTYYLSTDNSRVFKLDDSGVIIEVDMS